MMKYVLVLQCIVGLTILLLLLLQKTSSNVLDGLAGANNNRGSLETNFLHNIMVGLIIVFFVTALVLANLSNRYHEKEEMNFINKVEGVRAVDNVQVAVSSDDSKKENIKKTNNIEKENINKSDVLTEKNVKKEKVEDKRK